MAPPVSLIAADNGSLVSSPGEPSAASSAGGASDCAAGLFTCGLAAFAALASFWTAIVLEKTPGQGAGWRIYNLNVLGVWLVETYRSQFAQEINAKGVDGLIASLSERNKANNKKG